MINIHQPLRNLLKFNSLNFFILFAITFITGLVLTIVGIVQRVRDKAGYKKYPIVLIIVGGVLMGPSIMGVLFVISANIFA